MSNFIDILEFQIQIDKKISLLTQLVNIIYELEGMGEKVKVEFES